MPGTIHLWRVDLAGTAEPVETLAALLSEDEQERAGRYHFERDRRRFIVARGTLRNLLGRYLQQDPRTVQFRYGSRGKPSLLLRASETELCFNLSHSQELALYAFAWDRAVGIDVEYMRPLSDLEQLSQRFFCPAEHRILLSCPPHRRVELFFRYWTAKEACLKALGEGLNGLEAVELCLREDGLDLVGLPSLSMGSVPSAWELKQWLPDSGFVASLATQARMEQICFYLL